MARWLKKQYHMKEKLQIAMLKIVRTITNINVEAYRLLHSLDRRTISQDYHLVIQKHYHMEGKLVIAMLKIDRRIININVEAYRLLHSLDRRTISQDYHPIQKPLQHEMASPGIVLQLDLQKK
jgi:hypothetical protein